VHLAEMKRNVPRGGGFYRYAAQPLINKPFYPDKAILAWFSGSFANTQYQRSQGAMTTETLYA
jgi:hypothetical protein